MGRTWRNVDNNDETFRRSIRDICMADISRNKIAIKELVAIRCVFVSKVLYYLMAIELVN